MRLIPYARLHMLADKYLVLLLMAATVLSVRAQTDTVTVSVYFDYDRSEIRSDARQTLDDALASLQAPAGRYMARLYGYTDHDGSDNYNQKLSERRAATIRQYLIGQGMLAERMTYIGKGERGARTDVRGKVGGQHDRRVDVVLTRYVPDITPTIAVEPKSPPKPTVTIPRKNRPTLAPMSVTFLAKHGTLIECNRSNTAIFIPPNAFVDAQGRPVSGEVTVDYTEYRNLNDIVLSDLPMHYQAGDETYYYNSAGMFKIGARQADAPLQVAPGASVTVDFSMTEALPSANFYQLDIASGTWTESVAVTDATGGLLDTLSIGGINCDLPGMTSLYDKLTAKEMRASLEWLDYLLSLEDTAAEVAMTPLFGDFLAYSFDSPDYIGTTHISKADSLSAEDRYPIRLRVTKSGWRYQLRVRDLSKSRRELRRLSRYTLEPKYKADRLKYKAMFEEILEDKNAHVWSDVRFYLNDDVLELHLKGQEENIVLPIVLRDRDGVQLSVSDTKRQVKLYSSSLSKREYELTEAYRNRMGLLFLGVYDTRYAYNSCQESYRWLYDIRKPEQRAEYQQLVQARLTLDRPDSLWSAILRRQYQQAVVSSGMVSFGHYENENSLAYRTQLTGLGVYNIDQLKRIKKPREIIVNSYDYDTEEDLRIVEVQVLNSRLNSAMDFEQRRIVYEGLEGTSNALLIRTTRNEYYMVNTRSFDHTIAQGDGKFAARKLTDDWHKHIKLEEVLFNRI